MDAEAFRAARRKLGLTEVGFGDMFGVSRRSVQNWAKKGPPQSLVEKLLLVVRIGLRIVYEKVRLVKGVSDVLPVLVVNVVSVPLYEIPSLIFKLLQTSLRVREIFSKHATLALTFLANDANQGE